MDEFNHAKKRFAKYVVNYDTNIGAIKLKIVHSYEVVNNMQYLCQKLNLNQEDSQIALIIALLHDIGRFEQYLNCQLIYSPSRQTNLDKWLSYIAFIFDLHFDVSKKYIKENNYINRLFNRITPVDELTAKKYQELKQLSLKYIEE